MDEIAVLIPCYNESKTIEKVVKDFKAALPEAVIYVFGQNARNYFSCFFERDFADFGLLPLFSLIKS